MSARDTHGPFVHRCNFREHTQFGPTMRGMRRSSSRGRSETSTGASASRAATEMVTAACPERAPRRVLVDETIRVMTQTVSRCTGPAPAAARRADELCPSNGRWRSPREEKGSWGLLGTAQGCLVTYAKLFNLLLHE